MMQRTLPKLAPPTSLGGMANVPHSLPAGYGSRRGKNPHHTGTLASPEEGFHTLGGRSLSPSSRGLARDRNSTSHASQQIPLKPQDLNRGNDDPDQDPPQISSHLGSDILRLGLSGKGGHAPCRWKAELFCTQLDARDQRSMGLETIQG